MPKQSGSQTAIARGRLPRVKYSFSLLVVYALWALVILEPHRWLGNVGPSFLRSTLSLVFLATFALLAMKLPSVMARPERGTWCWPLLILALTALMSAFFAINVGRARETSTALLLFYTVVLSATVLVRHPRELMPILLLFPLQFIWWAPHAKTSALIRWHHQLSNFDGFGALMVIGVAVCLHFAWATRITWQKRLFQLLAAYCVLGVVSSNARGAFLATALVGFVIWLRSPRKLAAAGALSLGFAIVIVGASLLFPEGAYYERIKSVFVDGTQSGTSGHRWELWKSAFQVYVANPILGVGGANYGIYVVQHMGFDSVLGYDSAANLWNRNLHSIYLQVLSELGTVGSLAFIWMNIDFWKRNRELRTPAFLQAWRVSTGGQWDLRQLSYALEVGMIAYLATGAVYAQLLHHWHYTLIGANLALYLTLRRVVRSSDAASGGRARVRVAAPPRPAFAAPATEPAR